MRQQIDNYARGKRTSQHEEIGRLARLLSPVEPKKREALSAAVQGSVEYVSQINDQLRIGLLRQCVKLDEDTTALQRNVEATQNALAQEQVSVEDLVALVKAVKGTITSSMRFANDRMSLPNSMANTLIGSR